MQTDSKQEVNAGRPRTELNLVRSKQTALILAEQFLQLIKDSGANWNEAVDSLAFARSVLTDDPCFCPIPDLRG